MYLLTLIDKSFYNTNDKYRNLGKFLMAKKRLIYKASSVFSLFPLQILNKNRIFKVIYLLSRMLSQFH